ncbi:MAG: 5'/3'-nucleotidase SurE [Candidatus Thermoplasmatota archaeon]|nr:5'/3'-nucleotidase SurE [Candidatus Thermoplasmatota archaeon]
MSVSKKRFLEPLASALYVERIPLLLTNDDGVYSPGLRVLVESLHKRGHPIAVLAPLNEQSACGMKLTLRDDMSFQEHHDIASEIRVDDTVPLRVFSLDGSPCDCVIVAIDGGLRARAPEISPRLCISGINRGPNLSVDVLHSGTVSAARESALYGLPSMAISLATYSHEDYSQSLEATIRMLEAVSPILDSPPPNLKRPHGSSARPSNGCNEESIRSWMLHGNMFLNVNVPESWNGSFQTVELGARWYHNATDMHEKKQFGVAFEIGAATIEDEDLPDTDCTAVNAGYAAITPLASWPQNHPLGVPDDVLDAALTSRDDGLPAWL